MIDTVKLACSGGTPQEYSKEDRDCVLAMPPDWVHRSAEAGVLLTALSRVGEDTFEFGARWPASHPLLGPDPGGRNDPMAIAEIIRQSGIAAAHVGYSVPFGTQFIMADFSFLVGDESRLTTELPTGDLTVRLATSDIGQKEGILRRARLHMDVSAGDTVFARGDALLVCLPPAVYQRMRSRQASSPPGGQTPVPALPASLVGRSAPADVLLGNTGEWRPGEPGGSWAVQVDTANTGQFDHPLDHLPGMLQLEVFRQAALALTADGQEANPGRFLGCAASFRRIVDLEGDISCAARARGPDEVEVELFAGAQAEPATAGVVRLSRL